MEDDNSRPQRRAIPVSVIDYQSRDETHFMASSGLDFLNGIPQLFIQPIVELYECK